jgi:hypothetical protein
MPFLKIDTSGMNARYGRSTAKPARSTQVTEFNTPAKNRAPYIPKTEAKEGDVLSFFDDGKGKVLTSFDGGYQSAQTSKVSDMSRVDLGMTALDFKSVRSTKVEFKGVVNAGVIGTKIITVTGTNKSQYVPSAHNTTLYLDGTHGGDLGSFVRAEVLCEIDQISMGDLGVDIGTIVTLESAGNPYWKLRFNNASGDNKLAMATDEMHYAMLSDSQAGYLDLYENSRAVLVRGPNDWRLQSVTGVSGSSSNAGLQMTSILPLADNNYDLGSASLEWRNLYIDGVAYLDALETDSATIGTAVITDDSIVMTPSASDTVTIAGATNGILNITTVDAAGTAGDINVTADGQIEFRANDAAGHIFDINGTNQVSIVDGVIAPVTNNDIDLGTNSVRFKNLYIDGTGYFDAVDIDGGSIDSTTIGANGSAAGTFNSINCTDGNTVLGSGGFTQIDNKIRSSIVPYQNDNYDIGSLSYSWQDIFMQGSLSIQNTASVPTDGPTDGIYLFAEDVSTSSELKVVDEAANVTTLSPHNFSVCGGPSEDMAWAYYSENKGKKINVDMLKLARLVEDLSGEKLVYTEEEKNAT